MNILEIKNLYKKYSNNKKSNTLVLKGINLSVEENELVGIMGASGSGKITLLNIVSGIDTCDKGEVNIQGGCKWKY